MHLLKLTLALLAVTLMFAVQAVAPSEVVIAQDEAKPEAKPAWDDGREISEIIKNLAGIDKVPLATPLTETDINLFCRHAVARLVPGGAFFMASA